MVMVLVTIGSMAVGFLAGGLLKSPAQQAAEVAPPPRTLLTEPIQLGVVQQTVSGDAVIQKSATTVVNALPGDIVTGLPIQTDATVKSGQSVLEIGGRPVIALPGAVAAYREITPGLTGPDVAQLLAALKTLGMDLGGEASFGPKAQAAMTQLYSGLGYVPARQGDDELAAAEQATTAAERALRDARRGVGQAEKALERARRPLAAQATPQDAQARKDLIEDGKVALTIAQEARSDALAEVERAEEALTSARAKAGVVVPAAELVFVPAMPATIEVAAVLGSSVGGEAVRLVSGALVARAELAPAEAGSVQVKQAGVIVDPQGGQHQATVTTLDQVEKTDPYSQQVTRVVAVTLTPQEALPEEYLGQRLRMTLTVGSSEGEVLNVPVAAVSSAMDGAPQVVVIDGAGESKTVPVTTGFSGNGRVEIAPVAGERLAKGDKVKVGG